MVRGKEIEIYCDGKWVYPKKRKGRDNPAAIMRDMLIRGGVYDIDGFNKEESDKRLGQLYLYADEKIDGFIVDEKIYKPLLYKEMKK